VGWSPSGSDLGDFSIIGGYVRDYYLRAAQQYGVENLDQPENWRSEPRVAEKILRSMLKESGVAVHFHERLREQHGAALEGARLISITTEDGLEWRAKEFADCTYEGDLMAESHVSYTWGRESSEQYGESLAGVVAHTTHHQFNWSISAYDEHHRLLPEIDPGPLAPAGSGDRKVQSYNFRLILTNDPQNRLPFPRPAGYDRTKFALLARYLNEFPKHENRMPKVEDVFLVVPIPNHKADFNNNGPFSTDYIGHSWKYPEASYPEKAAIWQAHLEYTQSLLYFVSHDEAVPASLRAEIDTWGLPKDEFADTGHWPNQLYVREGRRMLGAYVIRQSDLQTERTKPDSIGMGSYNSDSHNLQRVDLPDGTVRNEGNVEVQVQPYEIPYRSITPGKTELQNLLTPVCLSATHSAYSSVRMEPQYMMIGQAAGVAAALAIQEHVPVQDISIAELQARLCAHGAILHLGQAAIKNGRPLNGAEK